MLECPHVHGGSGSVEFIVGSSSWPSGQVWSLPIYFLTIHFTWQTNNSLSFGRNIALQLFANALECFVCLCRPLKVPLTSHFGSVNSEMSSWPHLAPRDAYQSPPPLDISSFVSILFFGMQRHSHNALLQLSQWLLHFARDTISLFLQFYSLFCLPETKWIAISAFHSVVTPIYHV